MSCHNSPIYRTNESQLEYLVFNVFNVLNDFFTLKSVITKSYLEIQI